MRAPDSARAPEIVLVVRAMITDLIAVFFGEFPWARRWLGGHWERWWVEPCSSYIWLQVDACNVKAKTRPMSCFGTPTCEDHG